MNFGEAIESLKRGERVSRSGWNGKGMFLIYVPLNWAKFSSPAMAEKELQAYTALPFILMRTATNEMVPWLASQTDVLAEDWGVVG